jgi:Micrococcal nuclease (thermonuclease) homologs
MKSPEMPLSVLLLTLFTAFSVVAQTLVFQGRVVSVANGDTVTVLTQSNTEFKVRCSGIDAPNGQEAFASASRQRLTDLLLDEPVTVRYSQRERDGSLVGTILLNDRDICLDQVKAGMALYDDEGEHRRSVQREYTYAESSARTDRVGLWSVGTAESNTAEAVTTRERSTSVGDQPQLTASNADASSIPTVNVRGYFRKDGTYIAGSKRTAPDDNFDNNWSSQSNINPYTRQEGTKKQSRWITALKWIGIGAALGALIYLDAKYPSVTATARCNDGTYSYSQHRQGTCSHHGGVAYWLR